MTRQIISIDEEKCNGCGLCVPDCPEGALRIIDGKARLVGELLCDGLGACIGRCPEGALSIEEREAEDYDETLVMKNLLPQGASVVAEHLAHLKHHGASDDYRAALDVLREAGLDPTSFIQTEQSPGARAIHLQTAGHHHAGGCPGSQARTIKPRKTEASREGSSALSHWPIQMSLINPRSPHFAGSSFLLAADCTAFALASFHASLLEGKTLGIACPKLDTNLPLYREKLTALIDEARIDTLSVAIMEVPCCRGLSSLAREAIAQAGRKIPLKEIVLSVEGELLSEEWV